MVKKFPYFFFSTPAELYSSMKNTIADENAQMLNQKEMCTYLET
jgi:hypothetical protein